MYIYIYNLIQYDLSVSENGVYNDDHVMHKYITINLMRTDGF